MAKPKVDVYASLEEAGYVEGERLYRGRGLMIGSDGEPNTGKTEFALSIPGPGGGIIVDRMIRGTMDNSKPPVTRRLGQWRFKVIEAPLAGQLKVVEGEENPYYEYWKAFHKEVRKLAGMEGLRAILIDGDSDSWELQRLAAFGKLEQVPSIMYVGVNAARRSMYSRLFDSQKIIFATNKVKDGYEDYEDERGKKKSRKTGVLERQGFADQGYLWEIQLRHLKKPAHRDKDTGEMIPAEFGIRIMMCKASQELEGSELWGEDCNFKSLVQYVYPQVPLAQWGFEK